MYFDETLPSSREAEHTSDTLHATLTKEFAEDTYNKAKHGGGEGFSDLPWNRV